MGRNSEGFFLRDEEDQGLSCCARIALEVAGKFQDKDRLGLTGFRGVIKRDV